MKYLYVLALLTLVTVSQVSATEQGKHLFILSGQSNMEGKGTIKHLEQVVSDNPKTYGNLNSDKFSKIIDEYIEKEKSNNTEDDIKLQYYTTIAGDEIIAGFILKYSKLNDDEILDTLYEIIKNIQAFIIRKK